MIALLVAAGHFQIGTTAEALKFLQLAQGWGCGRESISRILIAGVHNSLACAAALLGQETLAFSHIEGSIATGMPGGDRRRLVRRRIGQQAEQIGVAVAAFGQSDDGQQSLDSLGMAAGNSADIKQGSIVLADLYRLLESSVDRFLRYEATRGVAGSTLQEIGDPFLPGKLALGMTYLLTEYGPDAPVVQQRFRRYRPAWARLADQKTDTWGVYFFLLALKRLQRADLLERCIPAGCLSRLAKDLDWRGLVDPTDYRLISKVRNLFGPAYAIALLRYRLGWDDAEHGEKLLAVIQAHYRQCSGRFGFADDTEGHGRYDRYSFLLIAELAHHQREGGKVLTLEMSTWLRRAVEVVLNNLNPAGDGFQYGRSIGAYGDSAYMEILAAAASHDVLTPLEARMAHAFCCKATKKFMEFWYDTDHESVNLWYGGRKTDQYRGNHRKLGETLSLLHHHIYVHQIWRQLGFVTPSSDGEFAEWLEGRRRYELTRFSEQAYSRALLTVRDGERLFNVPLVNGEIYHDRTPYFPIPFSSRFIQGVAGERFPQLTPEIHLADGRILMPLVWFENVTLLEDAAGATLSWEQRALDEIGGKNPEVNAALTLKSSYRFEPGVIRRTDCLVAAEPQDVQRIVLVFAGFSIDPVIEGMTVTFRDGDVQRFEVTGYDCIEVEDISKDARYQSPEEQMRTLIRATRNSSHTSQAFELGWVLTYRDATRLGNGKQWGQSNG